MRQALAVAIVVLWTGVAHAAPWTSRALTERELMELLSELRERHEEPVGTVAAAPVPRLGLEKGDIVRTINGLVPARWTELEGGIGPTVAWIEVLRRGKPILVRVDVSPEGSESTLNRDVFMDEVREWASPPPAALQLSSAAPVTKAGAPSGIIMTSTWRRIPALQFGDVVRAVNGAKVTTFEGFLKALTDAAQARRVVLDLDRAGRPVRASINLTDALLGDNELLELGHAIQILSDDALSLPYELFAAIGKAFAADVPLGGLRAATTAKPGLVLQVDGESRVASQMRLENGDVVLSINGRAPTRSMLAALAHRHKGVMPFRVSIDLERGGKRITRSYFISQ